MDIAEIHISRVVPFERIRASAQRPELQLETFYLMGFH